MPGSRRGLRKDLGSADTLASSVVQKPSSPHYQLGEICNGLIVAPAATVESICISL